MAPGHQAHPHSASQFAFGTKDGGCIFLFEDGGCIFLFEDGGCIFLLEGSGCIVLAAQVLLLVIAVYGV